jgi:Fe-S cluster assembly protein SufB
MNLEMVVFSFVTKRGLCAGKNSKFLGPKLRLVQQLPEIPKLCVGNDSQGEFYSVALTKYHYKLTLGQNDSHWKKYCSRIISKGISAGKKNSYRGLVSVMNKATLEQETIRNVIRY